MYLWEEGNWGVIMQMVQSEMHTFCLRHNRAECDMSPVWFGKVPVLLDFPVDLGLQSLQLDPKKKQTLKITNFTWSF